MLVAGGALGVVLIAAVAAFVVATASASASETLRDAGCTFQTIQAQGRNHIAEPDEDFDYNTDPPTSGPHFASPPPVSVYEEPVEQFRLIHDLEHGAIVIQYGDDVTDQTVTQLLDWWRDDPNGVVIAPYPKLGNQIALAAWNADPSEQEEGQDPGRGILAKCPRFDEEAFDAFKDEYAFKGPERLEEDQLAPQ
jgi:hypothetical protein